MGVHYTNLNSGKQYVSRRDEMYTERISMQRTIGGIVTIITDRERNVEYDQRRPINWQQTIFDADPLFFWCDYCQQQVDQIHTVGFEIVNPEMPVRDALVITCSCCQACDDSRPPAVMVEEIYEKNELIRRPPWWEHTYHDVVVTYKPSGKPNPFTITRIIWEDKPFKPTHWCESHGKLVQLEQRDNYFFYRYEDRGGGVHPCNSPGFGRIRPIEEFVGCSSPWPRKRLSKKRSA